MVALNCKGLVAVAVLLYPGFAQSVILPGNIQMRGLPIDKRSEKHVTSTHAVGYPFGRAFSDLYAVGFNHRRINEIDVLGCEPGLHVTAITVGYRDNFVNSNVQHTTRHGKSNLNEAPRVLTLASDEYVTEIRLTTWDKKVKQFRATVYHTRVGYLKFTTNKNQIMECGTYDQWDPAFTWGGKDMAFLYFSGSEGDALDQLQGHFIPSADF